MMKLLETVAVQGTTTNFGGILTTFTISLSVHGRKAS